MRLIDADALKELFSEVIGSIAKKPEMNGNLEHMIRASAMVIQMIDDAPSIQPERKDTLEKAVAVEAICDELMSRFDVSATYGYDFAEAVINRIEAMAKELEKGEQDG